MTSTYSVRAARVETLGRRARSIVAGAFAFATMLLPLGASGIDSTPGRAFDTPGNVLPLPPIPYLESMRWMNWKPEAPVFKTDFLLLPDNIRPGLLEHPSGQSLSRVS